MGRLVEGFACPGASQLQIWSRTSEMIAENIAAARAAISILAPAVETILRGLTSVGVCVRGIVRTRVPAQGTTGQSLPSICSRPWPPSADAPADYTHTPDMTPHAAGTQALCVWPGV
jgi:hypothetical protein